MKKFLLLIVVFGFIFTGCSSKEKDNKDSDTQDSNSKDKSIEIIRGQWNGDTFTSHVGEFKFTKPSSWYTLSDEEIAQTMGIGYEQMSEEWGIDYSIEELDDLLLYDMMVIDMTTGSSVNVIYESIEGSYTAKKYLELTKVSYPSMNYGDIFQLEIAGGKYYAMQTSLEGGYTAVTILKINNGIACCITVGLVDGGESLDEIISYFS